MSTAPSGYAELATQWTPYIAHCIHRSGLVPKQDVEDVIQDILADFVARDALSYYDPRIARFPAFLKNFTVRRCHRHLKYLNRFHSARALLDAPVSDDTEETFGGLFTGEDDPMIDWLCSRDEIRAFQDHLDVVDNRQPVLDENDQPTGEFTSDGILGDVFNVLVTVVLSENSDAELNRYAFAQRLGLEIHDVAIALRKIKRLAKAFGFLA